MFKQKKTYIILFLIVGIFLALIFLKKGEGFLVEKDSSASVNLKQKEAERQGHVSSVSGLACDNFNQRPIAVMLSGDSITRPLSGISQADLVVNMPVITNSITRMMAVYVCEEPEEIGSIRSARDDFIPLAEGFGAIYAHWGGSHFALDELEDDVIDNLNALADYGNAFYRKAGVSMPHNGFTSTSRLKRAAEELGYDMMANDQSVFAHLSVDQDYCQADDCQAEKELTINYPGQFKVSYKYNPQENIYFRFRGGSPETDRNNDQQVQAKVVAVIKTTSTQIEGQYNDVDVLGSGDCLVFQNGQVTEGRWQKRATSSLLRFLTKDGETIEFIPGKIWLELVQTNQDVGWE